MESIRIVIVVLRKEKKDLSLLRLCFCALRSWMIALRAVVLRMVALQMSMVN